ncbi:MAG: hypothetical protein OWQ57_02240 [Sulfobacillus sp.]|nr:hypothetical protein [Sulfobacillus sp.]
MFWLIGLLEAVSAGALATVIWQAGGGNDQPMALGMALVGMIALVATVVLGRSSSAAPDSPSETVPAVTDEPTDAVVERVVPLAPAEGVSHYLPDAVRAMHSEVERARWQYKLQDVNAKLALLEQAMRDDDRRHQRRRFELLLLREGLTAWLDGKPARWHDFTAVEAGDAAELQDRLNDLADQEAWLLNEVKHWTESAASNTPSLADSLSERVRYQRLTELEDQLEDLELLKLGYRTVLGGQD